MTGLKSERKGLTISHWQRFIGFPIKNISHRKIVEGKSKGANKSTLTIASLRRVAVTIASLWREARHLPPRDPADDDAGSASAGSVDATSQQLTYMQLTSMQDEIVQQVKDKPLELPPVRADCRFHLYCSAQNTGAAPVARALQSLFPALKFTTDVQELEACEHIMIHLTSDTWTRDRASDEFAHEVCESMRLGVHRWLVHEVPGVRMGDVRNACRFEELIVATRDKYPYLMDSPARLYNEIAMNLAEGEWRECGLIKMGEQLVKFGGAWRGRGVVAPDAPAAQLGALREPSVRRPSSRESSAATG